LWAFYGFHFYETPGIAEETFNRPLADKISDVRSPYYRAGLNVMATGHLFPRAYTWGLADTIRAGAEGRAIPVLAFGQHYYAKAPFYYFPGIIAAKLPLGLLLLSLAGLTFLIINQLPRSFIMPFAIVVAFSAIFLIFLMRGSSYAGVRHAMPLFTVLALLGAFAVDVAVKSRSYLVGAGVSLLLVGAMVSALPQMRPWEYFNETAGGSEKAYLYFNDEGVDLSQRVGEMANFYHANLEPNGEVPFISYFSSAADRKVRGMDWVGHNRERDDRKYEGDTITGTVMIGANELGPKSWWDVGKPFRDRTPVARFGNMFVFQGTFEKPKAMISRSYCNRALYTKIYVAEPDIPGGIELLKKSIELDPSPFSTSLELGNLYLKLGNRDGALNAYKLSLEHAPVTDSIRDLLADQVSRLQTDAIENIAPLRNPGIE